MNSLRSESINRIADRWAEIIWAVSWQFCILGLVVLAIHWSLRRASPNWRYWIWQILAIKLLLMPFWTAAAPWKGTVSNLSLNSVANSKIPLTIPKSSRVYDTRPSSGIAAVRLEEVKRATSPLVSKPPVAVAADFSPPVNSGRAVANGTDAVAAPEKTTLPLVAPPLSTNVRSTTIKLPAVVTGLSWKSWLMFLWLAGVCWYSLQIVWQGMRLRRRLRDSQSAGAELVQRVRDAATKLGLGRVPEVLILEQDVSPFVCGLGRASLVMPRAVSESFTPEQLDLVLLHELAHVRRRDLIWGWIPEIGRVLFFFHPLIYVVCNQVRFERELACDQLAMLSSGRDAAVYADTLVRVVGQFSSSEGLKFAAAENSPV